DTAPAGVGAPWTVAGASPGGWRRRASRLLDEGLAAFRTLRDPASRLAALGWSALIWLTAALNNLLVLLALRIEAPALAALVLLVVLQAGVTLPSLPATIGVFEGLCVAALALFQVPQAAALGYGVLLHLVVLLPPVLAGLLCAWRLGLGSPAAGP
ncbi:MAG TPA: lysylphosphatidylglycerol synthase domain-containing protein, partial [Herpetosiphonaceae bacterium]